MREDLYEQCSFHIAEKMPSSVKLGARPISLRSRSYSSDLRPWAATSSGVMGGSLTAISEGAFARPLLGDGRPRRKGLIHTIFSADACRNLSLAAPSRRRR